MGNCQGGESRIEKRFKFRIKLGNVEINSRSISIFRPITTAREMHRSAKEVQALECVCLRGSTK